MNLHQQQFLEAALDDIAELSKGIGLRGMSWQAGQRERAQQDNALLAQKKRELVQWMYSLSNVAQGESGEGEA